MTDDLYDSIPIVPSESVEPSAHNFEFLSPKVVSLLVEASKDEPIAYFETEYFGGVGDQGAVVAIGGKLAFGPVNGAGSINSAMRLLGVKSDGFHDEFDAVGLARFRSNEAWLNS